MSASPYQPLDNPPSLENSCPSDLPTTRGRLNSWVKSVWPLALHSIGAIAIALLLILLVDGTEFGLSDRQPSLPLAYSQTLPSGKYILLQSDIVTILSAMILLLRWVLAAWSIPFCWHSALYLMSKRGLPRQELKSILGLGALRPNSSWGHYDKTLIGVTLLFNLIASSVAPLLTGSVSWLPSSRLYPLEPNTPQVDIPYFNRSSPLWTAYNRDVIFRRSILQMALGHSTQAWGREIDKDILKRSIPSTNGLQIGSRLTEVTLPYFSVNSIEWLEALPDNSTALDLLNKLISSVNSGPMENGDFRVIQGYVGLMPKARWPNSTTRPFPLPDIIQETQLAVFNLGLVKQTPMFFADSSYPTLYSTKISQYGFALVNYTAGIARCSNCNISSPSTVQSEKKFLSPEKDPMTREAMWLAPAVLSTLVTMNSSIPFPANCSLNDYATALLTRSYSASWSALTGMDGGISQNTTYAPAIPSLKAQVDFVRVYIWLVIQLLVTLSSICFLVIYAMTGSQIVGDTTLTGFYLDTSDVPVSGRAPVFKQGGVLRLRSKGDRLKVDVQSNR